jgi:hypothetical protein
MVSLTAVADTVWQIGKNDGRYDEFALGHAYQDYVKSFPQDVHYIIGRSTPQKDWPFIQPGPTDDWAGLKVHPFTVTFTLNRVPKDLCRLVVYLTTVSRAVLLL